ncbi:helix-turn-helix domain-containing protein [Euzebya tangerina]|uniref:helix-turn-helix domain-containing protein n=1 Tax=Euzebya tangerina TaxID=591198 RepID=UPI000E30C4A7|nr:helix-turn-helix transcriptional regulator [Euzebya tangerina]
MDAAAGHAGASTGQDRVFPALLKYWRGHRGHSQLDLALIADVSSRHISFLETGRSRPSEQMVRWLAEALDVPLRDRNELLRAAGFPAQYPDVDVDEALAGPVGEAVTMMLEGHDPFPMIVVDRLYRVYRANRSARMLLGALGAADVRGLNLIELLFAPGVKALIEDWEGTAGVVLRRLQRESLHRPQDADLAQLLADLLDTDGIPEQWLTPALAEPNQPVLPIAFRLGAQSLSFLTAITTFSAPQNLTLDELQIESWFPADDSTRAFCQELLSTDG